MNPSVRHPSVRHPSARRAVPAALLVVATLLLTGCFRFESTYTINDDGTADVSILTVIDTEQLEELGGLLGQDTSELMGLGGEDLLSTLSEGDDPCSDVIGSLTGYDVQLEEISDGSEVGVKCTVSGVPIDELTTSGQDSSIDIEQDETGTRFTATLQGVDELTGGGDSCRHHRAARREPRRPLLDRVQRVGTRLAGRQQRVVDERVDRNLEDHPRRRLRDRRRRQPDRRVDAGRQLGFERGDHRRRPRRAGRHRSGGLLRAAQSQDDAGDSRRPNGDRRRCPADVAPADVAPATARGRRCSATTTEFPGFPATACAATTTTTVGLTRPRQAGRETDDQPPLEVGAIASSRSPIT